MFAHIAFETGDTESAGVDAYMQGLKFKESEDCMYGGAGCEFHEDSTRYPANESKNYYGRGPLSITGNNEYGAFGDAFGPIKYDGYKRFINSPEDVIADDYTAFASAIWFYMTPSFFKPSMHDIVTGFWQPNGTDTGMGVTSGFGATKAIINGGEECSKWNDTEAAKNRMDFY